MSNRTEIIPAQDITPLIHFIRDQRVILDTNLALLYGVETRALVQAVKRNANRFPEDFLLQLTPAEAAALRSQIVISKTGRGGRRYPPYAFTEHGALMAATVLNSPRAVSMSLYIIRAFVKMREDLAANAAILKRLAEIDKSLLAPRRRPPRHLPETPSAARAATRAPQNPKSASTSRKTPSPTAPSERRVHSSSLANPIFALCFSGASSLPWFQLLAAPKPREGGSAFQASAFLPPSSPPRIVQKLCSDPDSGWKRPGVRLPWHKEVYLSDAETYRSRGIGHVTTFAAWIDADYVKRYGELGFLAEYGGGLS